MSSVPFAIRLPSRLAAIIDAFAKKTGKSTPDAVRAGIEGAFSNEYRMLLVDSLSNKDETLKRVREYLSPSNDRAMTSLASQDYSAMMCFWHFAYMHNDGFANPMYVAELLDIIADLLIEAETKQIPIDFHYIQSKLDLNVSESFIDGISRIKKEFFANPSVSRAEWLTRPLEGMADDLQNFDKSVLKRIFDSRMAITLPVAVLGARTPVAEDIISDYMEQVHPIAERFSIGEMSVLLSSSPLALVVDEGHHCYAFCAESVLSIATGIAYGAFSRMIERVEAPNVWTSPFKRRSFQVERLKDEFIIHEHGGYRLVMKLAEFKNFVSNLESQFFSPEWKILISRRQNLRGDI